MYPLFKFSSFVKRRVELKRKVQEYNQKLTNQVSFKHFMKFYTWYMQVICHNLDSIYETLILEELNPKFRILSKIPYQQIKTSSISSNRKIRYAQNTSWLLG